jgi:hypothetical protein
MNFRYRRHQLMDFLHKCFVDIFKLNFEALFFVHLGKVEIEYLVSVQFTWHKTMHQQVFSYFFAYVVFSNPLNSFYAIACKVSLEFSLL